MSKITKFFGKFLLSIVGLAILCNVISLILIYAEVKGDVDNFLGWSAAWIYLISIPVLLIFLILLIIDLIGRVSRK